MSEKKNVGEKSLLRLSDFNYFTYYKQNYVKNVDTQIRDKKTVRIFNFSIFLQISDFGFFKNNFLL